MSSYFIYVVRTSSAERDVNMKRQLVEDLKTRLKFLQEMEKSYHGQVEDLEKKVYIACDTINIHLVCWLLLCKMA